NGLGTYRVCTVTIVLHGLFLSLMSPRLYHLFFIFSFVIVFCFLLFLFSFFLFIMYFFFFFFFQAEDGIRDATVTGVQTCALPIFEGQLGAIFAPRPFGRQIGYDGVKTYLRLMLIEKNQVVEYAHHWHLALDRSEERRVGKECRCWGWPIDRKKKRQRSTMIGV